MSDETVSNEIEMVSFDGGCEVSLPDAVIALVEGEDLVLLNCGRYGTGSTKTLPLGPVVNVYTDGGARLVPRPDEQRFAFEVFDVASNPCKKAKPGERDSVDREKLAERGRKEINKKLGLMEQKMVQGGAKRVCRVWRVREAVIPVGTKGIVGVMVFSQLAILGLAE